MNKSIMAALGVFAIIVLPGCMGRSGPAAVYLQVGAPTQAQSQAAAQARVSVGIGRVAAVEALNRQAVMLARGRVMAPSQHWYWEDTPGRLVERALAGAVNGTEGLAAVWPERWNSRAGIALAGVVTGFSVDEAALRLEITLECQLKSGDDGRLLATRVFTVSVPVAALEPRALADAGSQGLSNLSAEVAGWVRQSSTGMKEMETGK